MRNLASTRSRSPLSPRALPATAALMLVLSLGWLVAPAPAVAQDADEAIADAGVSGSTYESPAFGYALEWDESIWQVEDAETGDDNDFLYLTSDASDLFFESYERFDGDVADCLDNAVSLIEDDDRVTEFELIDEDGDDASAFATFSYIVTLDDEDLPKTQYSECRVLVEGESVLLIDHLAPQDDYEAESDVVADVIDTLAIPGAETDDGEDAEEADDEDADSTPAADDATEDDVDAAEATEEAGESDPTDPASDDEEAEPTEDASGEDPADDEEAPTPVEDEDEPTADDEDAEADATEESDATEDDPGADAEATEEADANAEDDQDEPADDAIDPDDLEGVDDDTYTSPTFGYTLEWDADVWTATAATSDDDVDTLVLENEVTVLTIAGTEEFGENLDRCVRTTRRGIEDRDGVADVAPVEDAGGDPIEIDEDERAGAVYAIESEDEDAPEQIAQVECRVAIEGEAVIQIIQITPASDFNDQIDPVAEILDSIVLEGADEEDETPTPEDEPTPDDEQEDGDESAVDGNVYVSPNFGYSLEWDEDVWTFNEGDEASDPGFDSLFIETDISGLAIIGAELPDPEACVTDFATFVRTNPDSEVDNWAPYEDEDGEQIEGERDDGYFAAFSATVVNMGQELELVYYFECRVVVEDESVVLFFMTTSPAVYDDAVAELDDLLDTLMLPGDPEDDEDAEPTPSDEDEEDADPTPVDDDEDAEPTLDDEGDDNADSTASSGDLDSYTDPDFPFSVTWDEGVWSVTDQRTIDDGHNLLNLTAEGGDLTIEGWARWEGVPTECLNDITLNLRAIDGVEGFERVSDTDLYPENDSTSGASALYSFTLAPEGRTPVDYYGYIECRTVVEGEAVVVLTLLVPADEYDAIRPEFEPILASIEIDA